MINNSNDINNLKIFEGIAVSYFHKITNKAKLEKTYNNTMSFMIINEGLASCSKNSVKYDLMPKDIYIFNNIETLSLEVYEPLSGFLVTIEQNYIINILGENKQFNTFLHVSEEIMEKFNALITFTLQDSFASPHEKFGFANYFVGLLLSSNLLSENNTNDTGDNFNRVKTYIDENYHQELNLEILSKKFGYNSKYISYAFNKNFGININRYINNVRIKKSLELKKKIGNYYTMNEIIFCSGFNSKESYYRSLKKFNEDNKLTSKGDNYLSSKLKKKKAVVVGYGSRGQIYANYALECPDELEIIAVVDTNNFKLQQAKTILNLPDEKLFLSIDDFLKVKIKCDFVINATMDDDHYETSIQLLKEKYNIMIEKPVVSNQKELRQIHKVAERNKCKVFICHVLRYSPFYKKIKQLINNGEIGEIMSMELYEHVSAPHYLAAFKRGKWNKENKSGAGLLLTKCCHDIDLICWLNSKAAPKQVFSTGSTFQFVKEKKPQGATEFCYNCPHERSCQYSAIRQYIDLKVMPFLVWDKLDKPLDKIADEEKLEFLKNDEFGKCAYTCEGNLVDRQSTTITFENGTYASFMLVAGSTKADRGIYIVGTEGEIDGKLSEDKFTLRKFSKNTFDGVVKDYDFRDDNNSYGYLNGHNGGDFSIMKEVISFLNGAETSISISELADCINGYECVYAAEESRKTNKIVKINKGDITNEKDKKN